ncbi:hypothetical protein Purlil1_14000 [Purpureocillium lilacinum]|uniref:Uncharacterized protein n=1 Tax=Purpureocillium lilacinum TaxID=33203 RepID=A0ABR0BCI1_PURLI|nr:hypothetical protein Purlil1_14000 [Purpureocillium lilacinum]
MHDCQQDLDVYPTRRDKQSTGMAGLEPNSAEALQEIEQLQQEIAKANERRSTLVQQLGAVQQRAAWQELCLLKFDAIAIESCRIANSVQDGQNGAAEASGEAADKTLLLPQTNLCHGMNTWTPSQDLSVACTPKSGS